MKLRFLGKETTGDQSPTLYDTDEDRFVVQGWKITDPDTLAQLDPPSTKRLCWCPRR